MVNELRARELGRSPEHHQRAHRAPANPKQPRVLPAMPYSAISAVARAPAAAASSTPVSTPHPVRSFLLRWMRKSTGYLLVASAVQPLPVAQLRRASAVGLVVAGRTPASADVAT